LVLGSISSCGKKRIQTEAKIKKKSAKQIQKKVEKNDFEVEWFAAKAKVSYTEPNNYSQTFNANVRVKTDSAIWISIVPLLGIEMARMLITDQRVQVLDRINKKYYNLDHYYVEQMLGYPVDFNLLQSALMGQRFYQFKRPKASTTQNKYFLEDVVNKVVSRLWLNPTDFSIYKMQLYDERASKRLDMVLSDYGDFKKFNFAKKRTVDIFSPENYHIDIAYSKIKFNEAQNLSFKISDKYEWVQ